MRHIAIVVCVLLVPAVCLNAAIRVPQDEPTIQAGINVASEGDTVLVAPGTYTGAGNTALEIGNVSIVLLAELGPEQTVIDCAGSTRALTFNGTATDTSTVLSGFTVRNGSGEFPPAVLVGEDLDPKIENCTFEYNAGGAIRCDWGSRPVITDCLLRLNNTNRGAGVLASFSPAVIRDCDFIQNSVSGSGGALAYDSDVANSFDCPLVSRCLFDGNTADADGGAVELVSYIIDSSTREDLWDCAWASQTTASVFFDCEFVGNRAFRYGGAAALGAEGLVFVNCLFRENEAQYGGAVYDPNGYYGSLYCGCTFYDNAASIGGAGYFGDYCPVIYSTLCFNSADSGSALATTVGNPYDVGVRYCILAFNEGGPVVDCGEWGILFYQCVAYGNSGGDYLCPDGIGNQIMDPLFCDAQGRDFGLCADSPCLPENHSTGQQIGAHGAACDGCATSTEERSWGSVKSLFR